jgi:hypothetical protein
VSKDGVVASACVVDNEWMIRVDDEVVRHAGHAEITGKFERGVNVRAEVERTPTRMIGFGQI